MIDDALFCFFADPELVVFKFATIFKLVFCLVRNSLSPAGLAIKYLPACVDE